MDRCQRLGALLLQHAPRAGVARIADDAFAERFTFDKTRDETFGQTIIDADRQHDLGCAHAGMECRLLRARLIGLAEHADERFAAAEDRNSTRLNSSHYYATHMPYSVCYKAKDAINVFAKRPNKTSRQCD